YRGLRKLIAKYVLPRANVVRCVSQRLKKQLIDDFGVAPEKITVVPIYIKVKSQKSKVKNNEDKKIFLTVGRLVPVKNIDLQIAAMAEVVKKYPQAELWIVGDGPEEEQLKVKSQKLKVNDKIKFLGKKNKEELAEIYKKADAFLLTSNSEGWGLAVIEAASYGLPIIMTDVGCAGEVIKNNESGLIITIGDKQSLIQAMENLLRDEALRQRIGEGARQAVTALPSKQETLNLYLMSWRKAMDEHRF
ncbi:glycosyltransferase family 4 protein, partial [Patescibacteria group bacterium]|nr:glycosyltransferase family 4 protein [Patescibacteria group bacterium]